MPAGRASLCTKTSGPSSRERKPKPFSGLNHLTLPVGTLDPQFSLAGIAADGAAMLPPRLAAGRMQESQRRRGHWAVVRLATFNLLHGRSLEDGRVDVDRLADAVKTLDADVLGLQEVDRDQPRSHGAGPDGPGGRGDGGRGRALRGRPQRDTGWRVDRGHGQGARRLPRYGVALLSRYPVVSWDVVRLRAAPAGLPMWLPGTRRPILVRDEPRVALSAVIDAPSGRLTVCTTHLSFVPGWNGRQLRQLMASLVEPPRPPGRAGRPEHDRPPGGAHQHDDVPRDGADLPGRPAHPAARPPAGARPDQRLRAGGSGAAAAVGPPGAGGTHRARLTWGHRLRSAAAR